MLEWNISRISYCGTFVNIQIGLYLISSLAAEMFSKPTIFLLALFAVSVSGLTGCHHIGTAPFCNPGNCPDGFYETGRDESGFGERCLTGLKKRCCPVEDHTSDYHKRLFDAFN